MNCILTIFSTVCQVIKTPSRCRNDGDAHVTERAALRYKGGELMSRDRRRRVARGGRARGGSASRQGAAAFVRVAVSGEIVNLFTKFQVAPAPAPVYIVR